MNEHIRAIVLPYIPAQAVNVLVLYDNVGQTNEVTEIMAGACRFCDVYHQVQKREHEFHFLDI